MKIMAIVHVSNNNISKPSSLMHHTTLMSSLAEAEEGAVAAMTKALGGFAIDASCSVCSGSLLSPEATAVSLDLLLRQLR